MQTTVVPFKPIYIAFMSPQKLVHFIMRTNNFFGFKYLKFYFILFWKQKRRSTSTISFEFYALILYLQRTRKRNFFLTGTVLFPAVSAGDSVSTAPYKREFCFQKKTKCFWDITVESSVILLVYFFFFCTTSSVILLYYFFYTTSILLLYFFYTTYFFYRWWKQIIRSVA